MPKKLEELFIIENPCGCKILVCKGTKESPTGIDFVTRYMDPGVSRYWRTPKHEHVVADILAKGCAYPGTIQDLLGYFQAVLNYHKPLRQYPRANQIGLIEPALQEKLIRSIPQKHLFHTVDLLRVYEVIMWQEITRFPDGRLSQSILDLLGKGDWFAAVGLATRKKA
jgi:hypothetical protein